ncbi:MAG: AMP-binding protein [Pseudomonadota bacterium]|nr:AMP-binding protein [Pseudomonadota bacterium]
MQSPSPHARVDRALDQVFRRHADRPALLEGDEVWTYGALDRHLADAAAMLAERGCRPGDRIVIASENSRALALLFLAAQRLDIWPVVVNPRLSARELDQIVAHSGARLTLFNTAGAPAKAHAERLGARPAPVAGLDVIAAGPLDVDATPEPLDDDPAERVAAMLYTSGTTGAPKGVMLSHRNLMFNARVTAELRGLTPEDCVYTALPMSHVVGLSSLLLTTLLSGGRLRLADRFDAADAFRLVRTETTMLTGVPATWQRLLEHMRAEGMETAPPGPLRYLSVAGAPLDPRLKAQVEAAFGLPLLNAYGITECAPGISSVREEAPRDDTSVGPILPGLETRLMGPDGEEVAPGEVGELHVRGPNVMKGYYRAPDLTRAAIDPQGWFNTGDLARMEAGGLFIAGRTKELIIRSGFNVYPPEVEAVLADHPDVAQSAVVGRARDGNEEVVAYVQLLPGARATGAEIMAFAAARLTAYKRPCEVVIMDALPAAATGKLLKHKLKELAATA